MKPIVKHRLLSLVVLFGVMVAFTPMFLSDSLFLSDIKPIDESLLEPATDAFTPMADIESKRLETAAMIDFLHKQFTHRDEVLPFQKEVDTWIVHLTQFDFAGILHSDANTDQSQEIDQQSQVDLNQSQEDQEVQQSAQLDQLELAINDIRKQGYRAYYTLKEGVVNVWVGPYRQQTEADEALTNLNTWSVKSENIIASYLKDNINRRLDLPQVVAFNVISR